MPPGCAGRARQTCYVQPLGAVLKLQRSYQHFVCALGRIRTCDTRFRNRTNWQFFTVHLVPYGRIVAGQRRFWVVPPEPFCTAFPSRNGPSEGKRWDKRWDTFASFGGVAGHTHGGGRVTLRRPHHTARLCPRRVEVRRFGAGSPRARPQGTEPRATIHSAGCPVTATMRS